MALALTIVVFLTIALVVFSFGAAAYAPSSLLGSRLRALGWQRAKAPGETRSQRASGTSTRSVQQSHTAYRPSEVSRARRWLIQAGYRESASHDGVCWQPSGVRNCWDSRW